MIYIYAQFYWYLVLSILYVVLLFYNSIQAARRGRQVPRSSESPADFWYELGLATQ